MEKVCPGITFMNSLKEMQSMTNADVDLLKAIFRKSSFGAPLKASDFARIAQDELRWELEETETRANMKMGKLLNEYFPSPGEHNFAEGEFKITKTSEVNDHEPSKLVHGYQIESDSLLPF
tara:strand:+ start:150 stop:512 length:363 start_codon:yes stop_codon:yes gene_type:complete